MKRKLLILGALAAAIAAVSLLWARGVLPGGDTAKAQQAQAIVAVENQQFFQVSDQELATAPSDTPLLGLTGNSFELFTGFGFPPQVGVDSLNAWYCVNLHNTAAVARSAGAWLLLTDLETGGQVGAPGGTATGGYLVPGASQVSCNQASIFNPNLIDFTPISGFNWAVLGTASGPGVFARTTGANILFQAVGVTTI